jgi:DNA-binding beta-propeller fold protein YncE
MLDARKVPVNYQPRALGGLLTVLLLAACATPAPKPKAPDFGPLVWPNPPEQAVIRWEGALFEIETLEIKRPSFMDLVAGAEPEEPPKTLSKPFGVAADSNGRVFVADTALGALVMFDRKNDKVEQWGMTGMGALSKPIGVAVDRLGRVYVSDIMDARVVVFDSTGRFINAFGGKDILQNPVSLAVNSDLGRIYVADSKLHQIKVFDLQGTELSAIGKRGGGPAQFNFPSYVAVASDGRVVVSDTMNFRIQILDADGNHIRTFGDIGQNVGDLNRAKGVAVDPDGHIYVVDASFNNFQIFDDEGRLLLYVGAGGIRPGEFVLPTGIYIDQGGKIYVADQGNHRVQIFQYLGEPDNAENEQNDESSG